MMYFAEITEASVSCLPTMRHPIDACRRCVLYNHMTANALGLWLLAPPQAADMNSKKGKNVASSHEKKKKTLDPCKIVK